jgi:BirA family biotin operon repressor/biotin-[acetyl-CoA-carboxylase] ligase
MLRPKGKGRFYPSAPVRRFTWLVRLSILGEVQPLAFDVLRLLSEHEFRSGEALAAQLEVSRASVWGALNAAQAAGVRIHRVHGRGYRLAAPVDWLDGERLARATLGSGLTIAIVNCCESTNAALLARAEEGVASGTVLAAEWQTRGRGRLGRRWQSGFSAALTFSILWRFA